MQDMFELRLEKGLFCQAYDKEPSLTKDNYLGEIFIPFSSEMRKSFVDKINNEDSMSLKSKSDKDKKLIDFIYRKPEWYPVLNHFIDIGNKCCGKVLMTFAIFR